MATITVHLLEDKEGELFAFKENDRVKTGEPGKNGHGTILDGKFTGKSNGGACSITYTIKTDAGNIIEKEQSQIEKVRISGCAVK